MTIGHLIPMNNGDKENFKEWMQLIIEPTFMGRLSATMAENKNKKNANEPDYILWENITKRGDKEKFNQKTFKPRAIGGVWKKVSADRQTNYLAVSIDTPLVYGGKFTFSLFETKIPDGANHEDYFWTYDAIWNPFKKQSNSSSGYQQSNDYAAPTSYTNNPHGKPIPTQYEDISEYT